MPVFCMLEWGGWWHGYFVHLFHILTFTWPFCILNFITLTPIPQSQCMWWLRGLSEVLWVDRCFLSSSVMVNSATVAFSTHYISQSTSTCYFLLESLQLYVSGISISMFFSLSLLVYCFLFLHLLYFSGISGKRRKCHMPGLSL